MTAAGGKRLAALVEAAWKTFETVAAEGARGAAQGSARWRPRHLEDRRPRHRLGAVVREEHGHQAEGVPDERPAQRSTVLRDAILESLGAPTDGSPIADRKWTTRYAAHRIAWHALDHAWEIEDRSEPEG